MIHTPLFKRAMGLLLIIGVMDLVAEFFYLHWALWWYDVILHFLSGALIGLTVLILWNAFFSFSEDQRLKIIGFVFLSSLTIGLLWELFEIAGGITSFADGIVYVRDTVSDLLMDITGGFFGGLYAMKVLSRSSDKL